MNFFLKKTANTFICLLLLAHLTSGQVWPPVPAADLSKISLASFDDDELEIPYYLAHFSTLANSIVESGPDRGFINIPVWRDKKDNEPYNARVMENMIALAYFYSADRPWNPYYKSDAVQIRLKAAVDFLENVQNTDGSFSEYGSQKWNLAATGFATMYLGQILKWLQPMSECTELVEKVATIDRKALVCVLNHAGFYAMGKNFSNQYTAIFAGGAAYLSFREDAELLSLMLERMNSAKKDFQSPAGYFYENGGTDNGYNLNTHHSNMWFAYNYAPHPEIRQLLIGEETKFSSWMSYNSVKEPGYDNVFYLNKGIEMRTNAAVLQGFYPLTPLGEKVEMVRAFNLDTQSFKRDLKKKREAMQKDWPKVPPMIIGNSKAYWPTYFLHTASHHWNPTPLQKKKAVKKLPYYAKERFVQQRMDSRNPVVFTFVRRPAYYLAFNSGPILSNMQRYGFGFLWHPKIGTILQSQTAGVLASWGTTSAEGRLFESGNLEASFILDGREIRPSAGVKDWADGDLSLKYDLGNTGTKHIRFADNGITVEVVNPGYFHETIPLLLDSSRDRVVAADRGLEVVKNGVPFWIDFDKGVQHSVVQTNLKSGDRDVFIVKLRSVEKLSYSFRF